MIAIATRTERFVARMGIRESIRSEGHTVIILPGIFAEI